MKCLGLITGIEHIKGESKSTGREFDFHKVNFIDTENKSGSVQSMTLPNDGEQLKELLLAFASAQMKVVQFNVFQNGTYMNFGGFVK